MPLQSRSSRISTGLWRLGDVLGITGLVILLVLLVLYAAARTPELRQRLESFVPASVFHYLAPSTQREAAGTVRNQVAAKAGETWRDLKSRPQTGSDAQTFSLGSSKSEVLAVQGKPTKATETVWSYGESEVYFLGDVVVGWKIAPEYDLRTR